VSRVRIAEGKRIGSWQSPEQRARQRGRAHAMRIGTANIRDFPDMPAEKVAADGKEMGSLVHLWGGQEIAPMDNDFEVIMEALGPNWGSVHGDTATPIFYRNPVLNMLDAHKVQVPFDPVLPFTARPRIITGATFELDKWPAVPPFGVVNCHFIPGAYNAKNPGAPDVAARRRQWDIEFDHLKDFVTEYRERGLTVLVLGDFNHPRPPKPVANFTWLVGARLDRIGVTNAGGVNVDEVEDGVVELNSDHLGQWTRVRLTKAPAG